MIKHLLTRFGFILLIPILMYFLLLLIEDLMSNQERIGVGFGLILSIFISILIILLGLFIDIFLL